MRVNEVKGLPFNKANRKDEKWKEKEREKLNGNPSLPSFPCA